MSSITTAEWQGEIARLYNKHFVPPQADDESMSAGTLYLRGNTWWFQCYMGGKRFRFSTGCRDGIQAGIAAKHLVHEAISARSPNAHKNTPEMRARVLNALPSSRENAIGQLELRRRVGKRLDHILPAVAHLLRQRLVSRTGPGDRSGKYLYWRTP